MSNSAATVSPEWPRSAAWAVRVFGPPTAIAGYTAGFTVLPNEWFHLGWLLVMGCMALVSIDNPHQWLRWPATAGSRLIVAFLLWMTLRSCCADAFALGHVPNESARGLAGGALLVLLVVMLSQVARDRAVLGVVGWTTGMAAGLAAFISIALQYFLLPGSHMGERLQNILVHGGLNPVCAGLGFGFAAMWLIGLDKAGLPPWSRRLAWAVISLLHLAAFFSGSRGVMLALACGHAALLLSRGWRRAAPGLGVLVITALVYSTSAPLMAKVAAWRAEPAASIAVPGITHHWQKALERGDNGRIDIYRAGWSAMDNLWIGTGQWGVRDVWQCDLQPDPCTMMTHLHSAFFATFVHGGIIGALLLLLLVAQGWRCAIRVARRNDDVTWLILLAFGCGGLLFDGESLTSLATAPRFEGLLLWVPLVVALARSEVTSRSADI